MKFYKTIGSNWQLLRVLTVSSWRARYRNSVLGFAWSVLEPLSLTLIFILVFSLLINGIYDGLAPYPVFVMLGTVLWALFAQGTVQGSSGVLLRSGLIKQVYFPREYITYGYVLTILVSAIVNLLIFALLLLYYGINPGWTALLFPAILGILLLLVTGLGLLLASLFVRLEDLKYVWQMVITLVLFASPVVYEASTVPPDYAFWYSMNPLVGILEASRDVLVYGTWPETWSLLYPAILGLVLLLGGYFAFTRSEFLFAERL